MKGSIKVFYLGVIKFKNGNGREVSASSKEILEAKIDTITDDIRDKVIRVKVYKAENVTEFTYEE
ncbi:hypothetical protein [Clostridium botulinum]|nr:hypothetical protein [Clostridium botulinum]